MNQGMTSVLLKHIKVIVDKFQPQYPIHMENWCNIEYQLTQNTILGY